jgi:hypothetical protein
MNDLAMFFRLQVEHTYFKKKRNLNLRFVPVGVAVNLINRFMLYFLERQDGFELYLDVSRMHILSEILSEENTDCLEFIMIMKHMNFLNYTEPDIPKGSFLLFQNTNPVAAAGDLIPLHHSGFVSEDDLAYLTSEATRNIPGEFVLKPNSFALIRIPIRKKDNEVALVAADGKLLATSGIIRFRARSTFWKYILQAKEDLQFDSLKIIDSKGQVKFSNMVAGQDAEGSRVYVTESESMIPLQEISDYQFQLKGTQNGTEHTIIQRLAEPDPDYLSKDNGKLYSTIFIYY